MIKSETRSEPNPIEFRVRKRLGESKLSVSEFARQIGVSRVALYHLFKGNYSREMLEKISKALSIPVHVLLMPLEPEGMDRHTRLIHAYDDASSQIRYAVDVILGIQGKAKRKDQKPMVIVVDDIEDNLTMLQRSLRKDFDVMAFLDPKEALETIKERPVDAVISDQRMPGMTGTDLLSAIQNMDRGIAKLIVSGYSDNEALMNAINDAKVDAFIQKPFRPADLIEKLQNLLKEREEEERVAVR